MSQAAAGARSGQTTYRTLALLGLMAVLAQIVLGGVVRVTGSGDACPDWPLCHGRIIPPLDPHVWLEFMHRLAATAVGVLVVAAMVMAWRHLRNSKQVIAATSASLVLVVAASILGGLTVLSELSWWIRLIHLGLAELTAGCLAVAWLAGAPDDPSGCSQPIDDRVPRPDRIIAWAGVAGLFLVILYGSYMVGVNYGGSCPSWPMCVGLRVPGGTAFMVDMGHRYMVAVVTVAVLRTCFVAWFRGSLLELRWMAVLTAGFLAVEIVIGALTAWLDPSIPIQSLHLTFATLSWVSMVMMVVVLLDPGTFRVRVRRPEPTG